MVDTEARRVALGALKRFLECKTDSDEYDSEYPHPELFGRKASKDRAIKAIYGMSWNWFDDLNPHKLEHEHSLDTKIAAIAKRCTLFLSSGVEYEWREDDFMQTGFTRSVLTTLGLIRTVPTVEEQIANHLDQSEGETSVWPFFRSADFARCDVSTPEQQTHIKEHA
jgi:hypothetical protein